MRVSKIHGEPRFHFKQTKEYANEATWVVAASTRVGHSVGQREFLEIEGRLRIKRLRHVIGVVDKVVNSSAGNSTFRATDRML